MTTTEWQRQLFLETQGLPDELLAEIVDFVQFLKLKKAAIYQHQPLADMSRSETQHLDEEFADYKSLYPVE